MQFSLSYWRAAPSRPLSLRPVSAVLWRHSLLTERSAGPRGCALRGSFCYSAGQIYVTNPPHEREALEDPFGGSCYTNTPGLEPPFSSNSTSSLMILHWVKLREAKQGHPWTPQPLNPVPRTECPKTSTPAAPPTLPRPSLNLDCSSPQ